MENVGRPRQQLIKPLVLDVAAGKHSRHKERYNLRLASPLQVAWINVSSSSWMLCICQAQLFFTQRIANTVWQLKAPVSEFGRTGAC